MTNKTVTIYTPVRVCNTKYFEDLSKLLTELLTETYDEYGIIFVCDV